MTYRLCGLLLSPVFLCRVLAPRQCPTACCSDAWHVPAAGILGLMRGIRLLQLRQLKGKWCQGPMSEQYGIGFKRSDALPCMIRWGCVGCQDLSGGG